MSAFNDIYMFYDFLLFQKSLLQSLTTQLHLLRCVKITNWHYKFLTWQFNLNSLVICKFCYLFYVSFVFITCCITRHGRAKLQKFILLLHFSITILNFCLFKDLHFFMFCGNIYKYFSSRKLKLMIMYLMKTLSSA